MPSQQERPEMHNVYLGWNDYEIKVGPEAYRRIIEIVQAEAVCRKCGQRYSEEAPNVAGLLCLHCFLAEDRKGLTYQGLLTPDLGEQPTRRLYTPYDSKAYFFLDGQGHVYTTKGGPGEKEDVTQNENATLKYWHFPRPVQAAMSNGQTVDASHWHWTIHGTPRTDDVVMIQHGSSWRKDEILFIVKRHGQAIQISRRKPMHRALLAEARAELEGMRRGNMYLIDGEEQYSIYESDVYRLVARKVGEILQEATSNTEAPDEHSADEESEEANEEAHSAAASR